MTISAEASSGSGRAPKSSPTSRAWATHAALVVVQFAFASQAVEAKVAMMARAEGGEGIRPEALAMARMVAGALFFQGLLATSRSRGPSADRPAVALGRRDHALLAALSVLGVALNQTLFLLGLRWTTPFAVSVLGATIPVFAAGLAVALRKETLSLRTALGIALSLSGVAWLAGRGSLDAGAVLVALNSLSYAAYVVLSRDAVLRFGALRVVAWVFTYGALLFAPIGVRPTLAQLPELTARGWGLLAYIIALPTIVAYALNAWALGRSSATLVTIYIYLQPLLAAALAWLMLGQTVTSRAGISALLVLAGLTVVATRRR